MKELSEDIAELRREIIVAINDKDIDSYLDNAQALIMASSLAGEETLKDVSIFLYEMNKHYLEFKEAQ